MGHIAVSLLAGMGFISIPILAILTCGIEVAGECFDMLGYSTESTSTCLPHLGASW